MNKQVNEQQKVSEYDNGIIEYYSQAGMDYEPWSRQFNMHFGYYRFGLNPFNRERMLDEMNHQVINQLQLNTANKNQLLDCLLYTSPSPRDKRQSRMPSSA